MTTIMAETLAGYTIALTGREIKKFQLIEISNTKISNLATGKQKYGLFGLSLWWQKCMRSYSLLVDECIQ
jgi:hypothetical protein